MATQMQRTLVVSGPGNFWTAETQENLHLRRFLLMPPQRCTYSKILLQISTYQQVLCQQVKEQENLRLRL